MQFIRNLKELLCDFRESTRPTGRITQMSISEQWSIDIVKVAVEKKQRTGKVLFGRLPKGAQKTIATCWFDPYHYHLLPLSIKAWLRDHVTFNREGDVVSIHDHGQILWVDTNKIDNKEA